MWSVLGAPVAIMMPPTINVGLAVTSHEPGTLATSLFSNVTITQP